MTTYATNNPLGSIDPRDLYDNSQNLDHLSLDVANEEWPDRLGRNRRTWFGLETMVSDAARKYGYIILAGATFTSGATVTLNEALLDTSAGEYFIWTGSFPAGGKIVPPGSTPDSAGGQGPGKWLSIGSASLRSQLSSSNGALLVGGAILECSTVALAQAITGLTEGRKVRTYYYNVPVVTDWIFTTTQPAAPTFYITAVGGYLILMTPNFASAGIIPGPYVPQTAWDNRNKITSLLLDDRFNDFSVGAKIDFYILGSIVPNRNSIKIHIEKGVKITGRYDDPSIPQSIDTNTGGMIDLVLRENYHTTGDYSNTGVLYDVHIELDGIMESEYNGIHSKLHNNNCIGSYNSKDCRVTGSGGINGSDHRGINFDGLCDNALVDVGFVRNTMDEPICMNVNQDTGYGCVRVGRMYDMNFGGSSTLRVGVRASQGFIDVHIGSFEWNGSMQPVLVGAFHCQEVNVWCGTINGVTHALRAYETRKAVIHKGQFRNTFYAGARAGIALGVTDEFYIKNIKSLDSSMTTAFYAETNQDSFKRLTIEHCDFSACPIGFLYVRGINSTGTPSVIDIKENVDPIISGWSSNYCNALLSTIKTGLVVTGATSFTYNYAAPSWNFGNITVVVNNGSANYPFTINIRVRATGTIPFTFNAGGVVVTVSVSGTTLSFSIASGGTFVSAVAHN